ncbi:MAG: hypothetical protein ACK57W_09345 [Flavobacteriales bacterium]
MRKLMILILALLGSPVMWSQTAGDELPATGIWLNTDYPLRMQNVSGKGVCVVVWHPGCTEVLSEVQKMQELTTQFQYIQLISIWKVDASQGLSRLGLLRYVQQYGLTHPVLVTDDLSAISSFVPSVPSVLLYRNSTYPEFSGEGLAAIELCLSTMEEWIRTPAILNEMSPWQIRPSEDPMRLADPIVEFPTSAAVRSDGVIAITEPAHHRLVLVDGDGSPTGFIGNGLPGYADGAGFSMRLRNPAGSAWGDSGELFIADPGNHRVRLADPANALMMTLAGNGKSPAQPLDSVKGALTPVGLPVDVDVSGSLLYVLTASTNQLLELNALTGYGKAIADFPMDRREWGCRSIVSRVAAGSKGIYTTMTDGSVWLSRRKEGGSGWITDEIYAASGRQYKATAVCEFRGKVYFADALNHIVGLIHQGEVSIICGNGSSGWSDGKGSAAQFHSPADVVAFNGSLLVVDAGNHVLRMVQPRKGSTSTIGFQPTEHVLYGSEVLATGDQVYHDSVLVSQGENRFTVKLDLGGWKLVADGRNEVAAEVTGGIGLDNEQITDAQFSFSLLPEGVDGMAQLELFLTLRSPDNPNLVVTKKMVYVFQVNVSPDAPRQHTLELRPRLLPG